LINRQADSPERIEPLLATLALVEEVYQAFIPAQ